MPKNLNAFDLAMMNPQSQTIVSISGKLETVLDLRTSLSLAPFVNIIKDFKFDKRIRSRARELNIPVSKLSRKPKELWDSIMISNWREKIILYNSPANSQIIGDIALKGRRFAAFCINPNLMAKSAWQYFLILSRITIVLLILTMSLLTKKHPKDLIVVITFCHE